MINNPRLLAPVEFAMSRWPGGELCLRSQAVRGTALRLRAWTSAPERCQNCRQPAASILTGVALCDGCRQRAARNTAAPKPGRPVTEARTARSDGGGLIVLRGHAIVFNQKSVDLGGFVEIIRPEAVDRLLAEGSDLRALWSHDPSLTIGRTRARTLSVEKDSTGLAAIIRPPTWAAGYLETVARGDISGMSFAFRAIEDEWRMESGMPVRYVLDMAVSELSVVSFPAYPTTDVAASTTGRSATPATTGRSLDMCRKILRAQAAR